ncbi:MAG: hypothetical protein JJT76_12940 [Clostridiaceae bacterium]|nr:hypothetical protein [Clostridiaceae bacterium]
MSYSWIVQTVTMLAIGAIAYFLKDLKTSILEKINTNKNRIEKVEEELNALKADLPFVYTLREDYIRTANNVDKKLDKIYDEITKRGA